jgi:hypothetical protein
MDDQVSHRQGNWGNVAHESMSIDFFVDPSDLCLLPSLSVSRKKCIACWDCSEHPSYELSLCGGIDVNFARVDNTLCDPAESFGKVAAVDNTTQKTGGHLGCVGIHGIDLICSNGFSNHLWDEDSHVVTSRDLDQDELGHLLRDAGLNRIVGGAIWT